MKAAGILFDKDGTLLDFEATFAPACAAVIREFAMDDEAHAGRLADAVGFDLLALRFDPASTVIAGSGADIAHAWAPHLGLAADTALAGRVDELFAFHSRHSVAPFAGVDDVLAALVARGLALGIATNDSEAGGRAHAEIAGIAPHISFYAGYDSGHGAKPGPGMVLAFAQYCGVEPGRIVMVGDSLHDMHAARAAGAIGVAVTTGLAKRELLAPHADYVIDSLGELATLPPLVQ